MILSTLGSMTENLIVEAADWHRIARSALISGDHERAIHAYRMRETLVRVAAAHSRHLTFHETRARAILTARRLAPVSPAA